MKMNMSANDKILSVLKRLREEYIITPKAPYVDRRDIHWHYRKPRTTVVQYIIWLNELLIDIYQLQNIFQIFKQEGLIEDYTFDDLALEINFPDDFENKANSYEEELFQKGDASGSNEKQEIKSILLITPDPVNFECVWLVINNDFESKLRVDVKNKQNPSEESYAKKLLNLVDYKEIPDDKTFSDYVNYSLFKRKEFGEKYKQTKIVKHFRGKITANEKVKISKTHRAMLGKPEIDYFPKT